MALFCHWTAPTLLKYWTRISRFSEGPCLFRVECFWHYFATFGTKKKVTALEMLVFNPHCTVFHWVFCTLWVDLEIKIYLDFLNFLAARYDFLKF
jgi:hypothetical protein